MSLKQVNLLVALTACAAALAGCGNMSPPKYENGTYVPPPAKNPLKVTLQPAGCDPSTSRALASGIATVVGTVLVNQAYDRFINWLDEKQANLSASSTGVATETLLTPGANKNLKGCLVLERGSSLSAKFSLKRVSNYWHMTPYSLTFTQSEAKEDPNGEKNLVADIVFATPGDDGKPITFFQAVFDLGRHKASPTEHKVFVGQDSGPYALPKADDVITMKVTATIIEHGQGRDWIRGVTDSLREEENRTKILQPIIDAISGKKPS